MEVAATPSSLPEQWALKNWEFQKVGDPTSGILLSTKGSPWTKQAPRIRREGGPKEQRSTTS